MSTAFNINENKEIAKQFLQFVSEGKVEEMCKMITPTWKMYGGLPLMPEGREGMRKLLASFGTIEQEWEIEDIIAEGDKVAVRATNTCKQDSFLGINATGVTQKFTAMFIHKIIDGKIDETWRNANDLGRLLQLGAKITAGAPPDNN